MGDDPALSPERSAPPPVPVYLLHGTDDNVIPAVESALLAADLRARGGDVRFNWRRRSSPTPRSIGPPRRARSGTSCGSGRGLLDEEPACRLWRALGLRRGLRSARLAVTRRDACALQRATSRSRGRGTRPGGCASSVIGPIRTRFSRTTGWPIASHMWRTWRLRPSWITNDRMASLAALAAR